MSQAKHSKSTPPVAPSASIPPEPIAIVGIGCMFPKAQDVDTFWANIRNGVDCITEVPQSHWNLNDYYDADPAAPDMTYGTRGGFLDPLDFEPMAFGIAPRDLEATDTSQLLGLVVAERALIDAGYGPGGKEFNRNRANVVLGVTGTLPAVIPLGARLGHPIWRKALDEAGVDPQTAEDVVARIGDAYPEWQENSFPGLLGNVVAGRIAKRLNLHGTNCVVDAACASSLSAVHLAMMELQSGRTDLSLCGGIDTFNDIFMYMCFSKTPALSPTGNAKPFAQDADGTVLGEGLGLFVLKRLSDAERDNDRIYAVIKGLGTSSDDDEAAIYAPSSEGQARALRGAYRLADVDPRTVEMVEAHGTGTKVGDATEARGLRAVYGESKQPWCALGSVKANIGHTKAAAGAAGLIKSALALYHGVIPPSIKVEEASDAVAEGSTPFYLSPTARPWLTNEAHPRRAAVSAFGFGGSNYHCVLESHAAEGPESFRWDGAAQIVAFSAETPEALAQALNSFECGRQAGDRRRAAAKSREAFDYRATHRLLVPCVLQDMPAKLELARQNLSQQGAGAWQTPQGIVCGAGPAPGKLAALFPGQGAQYVGMLSHLFCVSPRGQQSLQQAQDAIPELAACLYPKTNCAAHTEQLRQTHLAQPALAVASLTAFEFLRNLDLKIDAAAGHSFGELVALYAAGRLEQNELLALAKLRGELMQNAAGDDPGTMLAVFAGLSDVTPHLEGLDVAPANLNSPRQVVLSGAQADIEKAASRLAHAKIRSQPLSVAAAFHSERVASAAEPLRSGLEKVSLAPGRENLPVYANSTAQPYPSNAHDARELLGQQLAKPVLFAPMIEQMIDDGVCTFLEVGPGRQLTGLIRNIAENRGDIAAVALDASAGQNDGMLDLAQAVAAVAARGHALALSYWDPDTHSDSRQEEEKKPRLTVPISGANYRAPKTPRPPRDERHQASPRKPSPAIRLSQQVEPMSKPNNHSPMTQARSLPASSTNPSPPARGDATQTVNDVNAFSQALAQSQNQLNALADLQTKAAELHQTFLQNQARAIESYQALALQQQQILGAQWGLAPLPAHSASSLEPTVEPSSPPPAHPVPVTPAQPASGTLPESVPTRPAPTPAAHTPDPASNLAPAIRAETTGRVSETLLKIISDKTGYPQEMLDLGMGLQSDLGIDSIKRVEILSALQQELPEAPSIGPENLGELRTLSDIVGFLGGDVDPATSNGSRSVAAPTASTTDDSVGPILLEIVAEKTGYPSNMLDLSMSLQGDLGIDSIKRVEMLSALQERLPNAPVIKPEHLGQLQTLQQIAEFLEEPERKRPASSANIHETQAAGPSSESERDRNPALLRLEMHLTPLRLEPPVIPAGRVWILFGDRAQSEAPLFDDLQARLRQSGCDVDIVSTDAIPGVPKDLTTCFFVAPDETNGAYLKSLFPLLQTVGKTLRKRRGATLVGITHLDGALGWSDAVPRHPAQIPVHQAGVLGLLKSVAHEWPNVAARTVDLAPSLLSTPDASTLIEASFGNSKEAGIGADGVLVEPVPKVSAIRGNGGVRFNTQDVVLLTGGARGITAEVAIALAQEGAPRLALVGRSPNPSQEPEWLARCESEAEIKRALADQQGLSLKELDQAYRQVTAAREIERNLARIRDAGSEVQYWSVDVRELEQVATCVNEITQRFGPVTGFVHGAGVLADKLLEDKTAEDVSRVYDTKVSGAAHVLEQLDLNRVKGLVFFSSSTGRFGRKGQSDYAAANEVLNKTAQRLSRAYPEARVVAVNWGPWAGGMVTPALEKLFRSEGIEPIDLASGASYLMRELACGAGPAEVVVLGAGSTLPEPSHAPTRPASSPDYDPFTVGFERTLSVETHPFLESHVLNGKAVLPVAMIIEWFAHAALHGNPGLRFQGVRRLRVLKGVILEPQVALPVGVYVGEPERRDRVHVLPVELRSGRDHTHRVVHARAEVLLSREMGDAPEPRKVARSQAYPDDTSSIYSDYLFHGPLFHAIQAIPDFGSAGIRAQVAAGPAPSSWMERPPRGRWVSAPLAIDGAFQLMCLWGFKWANHTSLPTFIGDFRQYAPAFPMTTLEVRIEIIESTAHRVIANIDWVDENDTLVARLDGYECVSDRTLDVAFRRNQLEPVAGATA